MLMANQNENSSTFAILWKMFPEKNVEVGSTYQMILIFTNAVHNSFYLSEHIV